MEAASRFTSTVDCQLMFGHVQVTRLSLRFCVQAQKHTTLVGALYRPPKPQYQSAALLDYIEAGVDAVTTACPSATIVLAGDFN